MAEDQLVLVPGLGGRRAAQEEEEEPAGGGLGGGGRPTEAHTGHRGAGGQGGTAVDVHKGALAAEQAGGDEQEPPGGSGPDSNREPPGGSGPDSNREPPGWRRGDALQQDPVPPEPPEAPPPPDSPEAPPPPDSPEALYELLCSLQGRRLNDQRCSFRGPAPRRRCHSEPGAARPASRVVFSSMTSLQKEEFFQLVATAQGRRLDDQRAQLGGGPPPKPKGRSFRGSVKHLSFIRKPAAAAAAAAAAAPRDDLYNMILTTQAQGRLEDQRSRAPGPVDDEDFFSLLVRVQGGRMEEQRTEPPLVLLPPPNLLV